MTHSLSFGPFRLLPAQRQLLEGDKPVRLGSRAFEVLMALAQRAGQVVTRDQLISLAWPDTYVGEANLRVHISALRRTLGEGRGGIRYIANIPGRGYSFVARVERAEAIPGTRATRVGPESALPAPLTRLVGRDSIIETVAKQLPERRFISLVGPGGIGKTTVAVAVAEQVAGRYEHGAHFVDLARHADGKCVSHALAEALGVQAYTEDPLQGVLAYLADKCALVVLDNCEHVVEDAAALAEAVVRAAPRSQVLVTSREPLRAAGEWVHRLEPLPSPSPEAALTATEVLKYPAVQLFVERSVSSSDAFQLSDDDAPVAAEICRRLDGIPLAIEFAAATVNLFGVRELAARLDDRLSWLTRGRRTALPRHQTLRAMLDWSYELLPEGERIVLRRLAVFVGTFTLECGSSIAAGDGISTQDAIDALSNLVAKSLVTANVEGDRVRYRLLETTREYALEKLHESAEAQTYYRRHAAHYAQLFRDVDETWHSTRGADAVRGHSTIDNIRSALAWTFSDQGDSSLGVELTVAAVPLWMCLSLMAECRRWTQHTLTTCRIENVRYRMQLQTALGYALMHTQGAAEETRIALQSALADAEAVGDVDYQLRALWGLSVLHLKDGRLHQALSVAQRLAAAEGSAERHELPIGDPIIAFSHHYLGEETQARRRLERMLSRYPTSAPSSHLIRFHYALRITAQAALAEILWIQGFPDRAVASASSNVKEAMTLRHPITLCNALGKACPIMLLAGDLAAAETYGSMLLEQASRSSLASWQAEARSFLAVLRIRKGDAHRGIVALRKALDELARLNFSLRYSALLKELAEAHAHIGEIEEGIAAIDEALAWADRHGERWCYPELLRVKGELVRRAGGVDAEQNAARYFKRALKAAEAQDALSWQMRAAISLAQLDLSCYEGSEACNLLRSVYERFEEGFSTADLLHAESLFGCPLRLPAPGILNRPTSDC